jgi:YjjG family noncanonical pyrimidine nucleotidase
VPFTTLLFDLGHTLLDSQASEALAFEDALRLGGIEEPNRHFTAYDQINRALWAAVERREITSGDVRTARFEQLVAATGLDADPVVMADAFVAGLGMHGDLYPGVRSVLETLTAQASLALVTNGLSEVQRTRIERLDLGRYFDAVVISSEVGAAKPSTEIFDIAFDLLGSPAKESVLMVGDSLTSDIHGGINYGIATCWYNPNHQRADESDRFNGFDTFDFEVDSLDLLPDLVAGR